MYTDAPDIIKNHVKLDAIKNLPIYVVAKDLDTRRFIGGNQSFQRFYRSNMNNVSAEDLSIVTTDHHFAHAMELERQTLLHGHSTAMATAIKVRNQLVSSLCFRKPIHDAQGKARYLIAASTLSSIDGVANHERATLLISRTEEALGLQQQSCEKPFAAELPVNITTREQQVLRLMLNGLTTREIAVNMGLSRKTIETHVEKMKYKFNVSSRSELLEIAVASDYFRIIANSNLMMLS